MKVRDSGVLALSKGTTEDESIIGGVWAAGFHHVTAGGARFETYEPFISFNFPIFFRAAVNRR
jgi:hypothetical protein